MEYIFFIFVAIFASLIGAMWFFAHLAGKYHQHKSRKRLDAIAKSSPYKNTKPKPHKTDKDYRAKDMVLEKRQQEQSTGVTKYDPHGRGELQNVDDREIVGVAKPVGIWSNFIMKQKMGFIIAMGGLQGNKKGGFWVNLIKAQGATRGKDQGKGR